MDYIYYGLSVSPSIKTFKKNEFRIVRNIAWIHKIFGKKEKQLGGF
jgi:hypothetical protein